MDDLLRLRPAAVTVEPLQPSVDLVKALGTEAEQAVVSLWHSR